MKRQDRYLEAVDVYRMYEWEKEQAIIKGLPMLDFITWCKDKSMDDNAVLPKIHKELIKNKI